MVGLTGNFTRRLSAFLGDACGNAAIMVAFSAVPLMAGVGFAVDYARLSQYSATIKASVDAAALAGARAKMMGADAQATIHSALDAN